MYCFFLFSLLILCMEGCMEPITYRIPRRTFDNIIDQNMELQNLNTRFYLTHTSYMPVLDRFMFNVPEPVRKQVWGAIDILLSEPKESYECLVTNTNCIEGGLFLFYESCPVIRIFYDSGTDPTLWYETAIAERGWRNDTGYVFMYDRVYFKTNLDMRFNSPTSPDSSNGDTVLNVLIAEPFEPLSLNSTCCSCGE